MSLIDDIKKMYADCGLSHAPIVMASSPALGAFLAPILAHGARLDEEFIQQAKTDAHTLAFGKPWLALVEKHARALSYVGVGSRGANTNQPGSTAVAIQRAWRFFQHKHGGGLGSRTGPEDFAVFTAVNSFARDRIHSVFKTRVRYHNYIQIPEHVVCWSNKRFVVLAEKPRTILRNNNRQLHSTEGLAVVYSDGWGLAAVNGVPIPTKYVQQRELLTVKIINATRNVEQKRALIELFGYARWLKESNAVLLHQDIDRDGRPRKLWALHPIEDLASRSWRGPTDLNLLEVVNSTPEPDGTFKTYYLQVPGTCILVSTALAWMLDDMNPGWAIEPTIET